MSLKWKCSNCHGNGGGPIGREIHTDWWEHGAQFSYHQEQCSWCKGTGILPYREENELAFENGEYNTRLIRERGDND